MSTKDVQGLFGLNEDNCNISFATKGQGGWGKNKFNNAFPVALCLYMGSIGLDFPYVMAENSTPQVKRSRISAEQLFGGDAVNLHFEFEGIFEPFREYVDGNPNKSDVIVSDSNGNPSCALEIKLTTVPDQTTVRNPREAQAPEFVTRPLMVELLATNICRAFGHAGRGELNALLLKSLGNPNNWQWSNQPEMYERLPLIRDAIASVICSDSVNQVPMVMHPIWRTHGDSMRLDSECLDCFVWSDFGIAMLYLQALESNISQGNPSISRESRSAVWLAKMLWDYSTAGQLTMSEVIREIAFGNQQDKAGSFSGRVTLDYLQGIELAHPRIGRDQVGKIVLGNGFDYLNPERRLDASLYLENAVS